MEERNSDFRIYIISTLFFASVAAGGVFLFLYLLLPERQSSPWYPIAGLILVAIPWVFWFITYVYRCFMIRMNGAVQPLQRKSTNTNNFNNNNNIVAGRMPSIAAATHSESNVQDLGSPALHTPPNGERRVHFGGIVVLGSGSYSNAIADDKTGESVSASAAMENGDKGESSSSVSSKEAEGSITSRESEQPLHFSSSSR